MTIPRFSFGFIAYLFTIFLTTSLQAHCSDFFNSDAMRVSTYEEPKKAVAMKNQTGAPDMNVGTAPANDLRWTAPKAWKEKAASSMRVASFDVPGSLDGSIVALAGDGGGLLANLNRWRGQIGLAPLSHTEAEKLGKAEAGAEGKIFWYQMENSKGDAVIAAVIPLDSKTVFVKLSGQKGPLRLQRASFLSLAKSITARKN